MKGLGGKTDKMIRQNLNGKWEMKECGAQDSYPAAIPGSVLSCLLENKAIKDPYFRDNEYEIRDLFWKDYEFQRKFTVEDGMLLEESLDLVCYGLDTLCDIYLNGSLAATADNMHRTWRLPVMELLHQGENEIRIVFHSTLKYIEDYEYEENKKISYQACGTMEGNQLIRKAHSMFGWDWGAQLPDAGIFRDVVLEAYSEARLEEVRIDQLHGDGEVELQVHSFVRMLDGDRIGLKAVITVTGPDGKESAAGSVPVSAYENTVSLKIASPLLWWPNGFGDQNLYMVKAELFSREELIESKEYRIGLRTLTISQDKDEWGSEFAFKINGIKIFTKGANYIPEDCIYSWITPERIEYLVKSSARANYNCLRVWGGGYYPSDTFYDLCDRYGLIVWQDLMYACNVYDVTDSFALNIVAETGDNVKRIRHHASLGLWCGNNEIESAWDHWDNFQDQTKYLRADYIKQFEYLLPKAVKENDEATFFWPSSPSSGGCLDAPDDENRGDTHYWSVWHGLLPFSDYQKHYFRFCSEFGFQSFPCLKTVKTYTEPGDRNIFSKVMESHQKNDSANGKMLYYLSENFNYPKDFENLLYVTQVLQGMAIKSGVEHFRRNRGRCMGSLYWQLNDNWPVASWASIDYYGRWKALHYMAKNFYAPIAGSLVRHENCMEAHIQNETLKSVWVKVLLCLKTMDLEVLDSVNCELEITELSAAMLAERDYTELLKRNDADSLFVELSITYPDGSIRTEIETFEPFKHMKLPKANITAVAEEKDDMYVITLDTDKFAGFVELDFEEADAIFEDNYFALTGTASKKVRLLKEDIRGASFKDAEDLCKQMKIRSVRDSYSC